MSDEGRVVVGVGSLAVPNDAVPDLEASLPPAERERATGFRFPDARRRFVVSRAFLRALLGDALGCDPAAVALVVGEDGKPRLAEGEWRFNLAHSGDRWLAALADGRELGIDLEEVRAGRDVERLAGRWLSPAEREAVAAEPEGEPRLRAFLRAWTRKEALLKALGTGLRTPLSSFDVDVAPGGDDLLGETRFDPGARDRWRVLDLPLGPRAVGALAIAAGPVASEWRTVGWDPATGGVCWTPRTAASDNGGEPNA